MQTEVRSFDRVNIRMMAAGISVGFTVRLLAPSFRVARTRQLGALGTSRIDNILGNGNVPKVLIAEAHVVEQVLVTPISAQ